MEFVAVEQGARRDQGDSAGGLDYRITQGANERVQLEAMLASLALGTYRPGPLRRISRSGYLRNSFRRWWAKDTAMSDLADEYRLEYFEEGVVRRSVPSAGPLLDPDESRRPAANRRYAEYGFIDDPGFDEAYTLEEMRGLSSLSSKSTATNASTLPRRRQPLARRRPPDTGVDLRLPAAGHLRVDAAASQPADHHQPALYPDAGHRQRGQDRPAHDGLRDDGPPRLQRPRISRTPSSTPTRARCTGRRTVRYCDELFESLGADLDELVYIEDPWVGGGNAGPALEVIYEGAELATLVFMSMEQDPEGEYELKDGNTYAPMDTYVVDTGYRLERWTWMSQGTPTVYEAIYPDMIAFLKDNAGVEMTDDEAGIVHRAAKLAGHMDIDEGRGTSRPPGTLSPTR